jgi:hypothetical protein
MPGDKSHLEGENMNTKRYAGLGATLALIAFAADAGGQEHATPATMTDEEMIESAMAAAPEAVGKDATIVAIGADGKMRTLREGSNEFTCLPDNPASPGPDPMCGDTNAMAWAQAWMTNKEPPAGKVGFMYMLAGGTDASNRPSRDRAGAWQQLGRDRTARDDRGRQGHDGGVPERAGARYRVALRDVGRHALRASHAPGALSA